MPSIIRVWISRVLSIDLYFICSAKSIRYNICNIHSYHNDSTSKLTLYNSSLFHDPISVSHVGWILKSIKQVNISLINKCILIVLKKIHLMINSLDARLSYVHQTHYIYNRIFHFWVEGPGQTKLSVSNDITYYHSHQNECKYDHNIVVEWNKVIVRKRHENVNDWRFSTTTGRSLRICFGLHKNWLHFLYAFCHLLLFTNFLIYCEGDLLVYDVDVNWWG